MNAARTTGSASLSIPEDNDVVVIGSGLGGLTCALELARQGQKVCVLEKHRVAGGYAHSFRRKGYHFDISLHIIGGLDSGCLTHGVLNSLGVLEKLRLNRRETLFSAEFPDFSIVLPNNRDRLLDELYSRFPGEQDGLAGLFAFLPKLKYDLMGPWIDPGFEVPLDKRISADYLNKTLADLIDGFVSDPRLRAILGQLWMSIGLPPSLSTATFSTCVFCSSFLEGAYHIVGGGAALVRAIIERLRELGSECITRAEVRRIAIKDKAVSGVELENGQFVPASTVVSGADPFQTFFKLIEGDEVSQIYRYRIEQMEGSLSFYSLYLGLDCPPSQLGIPGENFFFNHQVDHDKAYRNVLSHDIGNTDWCLTNYEDLDVSISPKDTGIVSIVELTPVRDWLDLEKAEYKYRKEEVLSKLLDKYERRFSGLRDHIAVMEFATPRTMARYTNNHQGAVYGLAQTVEQSNSKRLRNRSPIGGLFLTGSWTWAGGGYEGAIMTGIQTADSVLAELNAPRPGSAIRLESSKETRAESIPSVDGPHADLDDYYYCFRIPVSVYGDDLNSRGFVDVSAFLRYMDRGRVEAIEEICMNMNKESWLTSYIVNVYSIKSKYFTTASLGESLEVRTGIRKTSSHRAAFDQQIYNVKAGELIVDSVVEVLFLNNDRTLVPVPDGIEVRVGEELEQRTKRQTQAPFGSAAYLPFRTPFRVYYEDTDAQAITYHVSYVRFCERALFALVATVFPEMTTQAWMMKNKVSVIRTNIRYLKSSTLGDCLEVCTGVIKVTSDSIVFGQRIIFKENEEVVADVTTEVIRLDEDGKQVPLPAQMRDAAIAVLPPNGADREAGDGG